MPPRRTAFQDSDEDDEAADDAVEAARTLRLAKQQRRTMASAAAAAAAARPVVVAADSDEEAVIEIDRSRAAVRIHADALASSAGARDEYTVDRIAQLKRESQRVADAGAAPAAVVSGMDALRIAENAQRSSSTSSSSSSSTSSSSSSSSSAEDSDAESRPQSPTAELGIKVKRGYDTPKSLLSELEAFAAALRERRVELTTVLGTMHVSTSSPELVAKEAALDAATKKRTAIADMALYLRGLRACLGGLEPVIARAERAAAAAVASPAMAALLREDAVLYKAKFKLALTMPSRPLTNDAPAVDVTHLFANVHEDFATGGAVVRRFAQWRQADASSFDAAHARDALPALLAPFIRWSVLVQARLPSNWLDWPGMPRDMDDDLVQRVALLAAEGVVKHVLTPWTVDRSPQAVDGLVALARLPHADALRKDLGAALKQSARAILLPTVEGDLELDPAVSAIVNARLECAVSLLQSLARCRNVVGAAAGEAASELWGDANLQHCLRRRPDLVLVVNAIES